MFTIKQPSTILLWPHRVNEDKQPEIIKDMKGGLANKVLMTQNMNLTKFVLNCDCVRYSNHKSIRFLITVLIIRSCYEY